MDFDVSPYHCNPTVTLTGNFVAGRSCKFTGQIYIRLNIILYHSIGDFFLTMPQNIIKRLTQTKHQCILNVGMWCHHF